VPIGISMTGRSRRNLDRVEARRPVPWVSAVLYGAVLLAGGYAQLTGAGRSTGVGAGRPVLFVAGLAVLFALEFVELRRWPAGTPAMPAAGLLGARAVLFLAVAAADGSGLSRALFVLIPFTAYFAFGRTVSIVLGVGCVAVVVAGYQLRTPGWYRDVPHVSDLLMFAVGLVLTITMAAVAVREQALRVGLERSHEQLRAYADRVADLSATAERNRVARDIHDGLGHHLTAIALLLEKATAFAERDPRAAQRAVSDAHGSARAALDEVRRSVRMLRADPPGLRAALAELVQGADGAAPAGAAGWPPVSLAVEGDEEGYDETALSALYRAAQEGITNARRHARATRVSVSVALGDAGARLVVTDDGRGFPPGREGFGLLGMRERVHLAGGRVELETAPGNGTRLTVTVPRGADR
jgi:signal transduction histidine kinase